LANKKKLALGGLRFYLIAFVSVGLLVLGATGLTYQLVLQSWDSQLKQELGDERLGMFRQLVMSRFATLTSGTDGLATAISKQAPGDQVLQPGDWGEGVAKALPDLRRVVTFAAQQINRDDHPVLPVSFAAVELLKKAAAGQKVSPVAFKGVDKRWFILCAAALTGAQGQINGTLLAIYEPRQLEQALASLPAGKYELFQQVDNTQTLVFEAGEGAGNTLLDTLGESGWQIAYTLPEQTLMADKSLLYWGLSVLAALLAATSTLCILMLFGRHVARDISALAAYAGNLLSNGNSPPSRTLFPLTRHAMEVLAQLRVRRSIPEKTVTATDDSELNPDPSVRPEKHVKAETKAGVESAAGEEKKVASGKKAVVEPREAEPLFSGDDALDIYDSAEDLLGLHDGVPASEKANGMSGFEIEETEAVHVDPSMFRAYDIRGVAGDNLTEEVMVEVGRALGAEALERGQQVLCVGRDGRHSSLTLAQALMRGLMETGVNVIDVGLVPTPVLYFATFHLNTGSGAMVTGSHNPPEYNGVKMVLGGQTLADEGIQGLLLRIRSRHYPSGAGKKEARSVTQDYIDTIVGDIAVAAPLKVVLDAGNGAAGEIAPILIGELGCEVVALNCEIDGDFPAHHPDPGKPENLQQLIAKVRETGADLGIAFDGDGDRLGVVTNSGKIIWPDRLLMLFAKDVVSRNPGADVIFDVKCSRRLNALISGYGGRPVMWRAGHSVMKAKMLETGALLAGEMSGHIFFKERWFGFDDGIYSAARLLEILGVEDGSVDDVFDAFPEDISTPELAIQVSDTTKFLLMQQLAKTADWGGGTPSMIDGIRVEYADGWGLCRASNTTPALGLRFEAETTEGLQRIQDIFRKQILAVDSALKLPF
jgi:phosphomannomutase/phosphoglucomutase